MQTLGIKLNRSFQTRILHPVRDGTEVVPTTPGGSYLLSSPFYSGETKIRKVW